MPAILERKDSAITYQQLRTAIEIERNARLLAEKKILEYQTKVDKAIALAKSVLDMLEAK